MRYQLEKYNGPSSRHRCPACGQKKKFTRYIDIDIALYLDEDVGRCDRESSCGYHLPPREYFERWGRNGTRELTRRRKGAEGRTYQTSPVGFDTIPLRALLETLEPRGYRNNCFLQFLLAAFEDQVADTIRAFRKYLVGTGKDGETIFWQIDENRRVRTGKVMLYNMATGKRRKDRNPNWIHSVLKRFGELPETFRLRQCFFGQHLVARNGSLPIAIVESEKTAIVATLCKVTCPDVVWVATGSKSGLTVEKLARLATRRRLILYPDADAFDAWSETATRARRQGVDVRVSRLIESLVAKQPVYKGLDLADCLIAIQHEKNCEQRTAFNRLQIGNYLEEIREERMAIMMIDGGASAEEARAYVSHAGFLDQVTHWTESDEKQT